MRDERIKMNLTRRRATLRACISTLGMATATLYVTAAHSQTTEQATEAHAPDNSDSTQDIVVTAQKRSERLLDVPLSITAASGDQLTRQGITSTEQLTKLVPGFSYQKSTYGVPIFSLRGVGFYDTAVGVSPTVSVYLNQVPLPYSVMASGVILDLERVEVLKGPQGTLFGQNSTGGAINFIAAKPTSELSGGASLEVGRFNSVSTEAFISGPITSNLRARISGRYEYRDAWQQGYAPNDTKFGKQPGDELGRRDFYTGRFLLDWDPTSNLNFELNVNGWKDGSDTQASQFVRFVPSMPPNAFNQAVYNAYLGSPAVQPLPANARLAGWDAGQDYASDNHFYQASFIGGLDLGGAKITSITAYSRYHQNSLVDVDGTAYAEHYRRPVANIESFSQELRADGSIGRLKWLVGGNYSQDTTDEKQYIYLGTTNASLGPFQYNTVRDQNHQRIKTWAAFGSLDYKLTNQLTLSGSLRFTHQDRSATGCLADSGDGKLATAFGGAFGTPTTPGNCVTMANATPPFQLLPTVAGTLNQQNLSWRSNLSWKPTGDTLLYASIAKGYKAGSYTVLPALFASQFEPVTQEALLAYEAGFKISDRSRHIELSGAGFYYDYSNKQVLGTKVIFPFGNLPKLVNIPKSRVVGAELAATLRPFKGFTFTGGATYVNSKVQRNPPDPFDPFGNATSFVGEEFPNTPKWQVVGDAEYRFPVGTGTTMFFGGNMNYRSSAKAALGDLPDFVIPQYTLLDLRAGIESSEGKWRAQIWGRNVTNKFYLINIDQQIDNLVRTTGMPATYGVTVSFRFD
jgi:iron complex outermembrane receptor protein